MPDEDSSSKAFNKRKRPKGTSAKIRFRLPPTQNLVALNCFTTKPIEEELEFARNAGRQKNIPSLEENLLNLYKTEDSRFNLRLTYLHTPEGHQTISSTQELVKMLRAAGADTALLRFIQVELTQAGAVFSAEDSLLKKLSSDENQLVTLKNNDSSLHIDFNPREPGFLRVTERLKIGALEMPDASIENDSDGRRFVSKGSENFLVNENDLIVNPNGGSVFEVESTLRISAKKNSLNNTKDSTDDIEKDVIPVALLPLEERPYAVELYDVTVEAPDAKIAKEFFGVENKPTIGNRLGSFWAGTNYTRQSAIPYYDKAYMAALDKKESSEEKNSTLRESFSHEFSEDSISLNSEKSYDFGYQSSLEEESEKKGEIENSKLPLVTLHAFDAKEFEKLAKNSLASADEVNKEVEKKIAYLHEKDNARLPGKVFLDVAGEVKAIQTVDELVSELQKAGANTGLLQAIKIELNPSGVVCSTKKSLTEYLMQQTNMGLAIGNQVSTVYVHFDPKQSSHELRISEQVEITALQAIGQPHYHETTQTYTTHVLNTDIPCNDFGEIKNRQDVALFEVIGHMKISSKSAFAQEIPSLLEAARLPLEERSYSVELISTEVLPHNYGLTQLVLGESHLESSDKHAHLLKKEHQDVIFFPKPKKIVTPPLSRSQSTASLKGDKREHVRPDSTVSSISVDSLLSEKTPASSSNPHSTGKKH